jgi:hypothetical protein
VPGISGARPVRVGVTALRQLVGDPLGRPRLGRPGRLERCVCGGDKRIPVALAADDPSPFVRSRSELRSSWLPRGPVYRCARTAVGVRPPRVRGGLFGHGVCRSSAVVHLPGSREQRLVGIDWWVGRWIAVVSDAVGGGQCVVGALLGPARPAHRPPCGVINGSGVR